MPLPRPAEPAARSAWPSPQSASIGTPTTTMTWRIGKSLPQSGHRSGRDRVPSSSPRTVPIQVRQVGQPTGTRRSSFTSRVATVLATSVPHVADEDVAPDQDQDAATARRAIEGRLWIAVEEVDAAGTVPAAATTGRG